MKGQKEISSLWSNMGFPLSNMLEMKITLIVSLCLPPTGSGDILFFPVRLSVCLSVRHKSCPLYNLKTVKDFSMKLGTLVNQDETMCHAQEP